MNGTKIEIPTPDPTRLTTEQLDKGLLGLREILETRIHCMEEDVEHQQEIIDQRGASIVAEVGNLEKLQNEKFRAVAQQFTERDTRTEQTARDTKVAVDAALQAAEKAVGKQNEAFAVATAKSEAATTKQIDAIGVLIATTNKASDDKINDLKSSIAGINAVLAQFNGRSKGIGDLAGWLFGAAALVLAVIFHFLK